MRATPTVEASARDLANLARGFAAETLRAEVAIVRKFQREAANLAAQAGRIELTETEDERLAIEASGRITADVVPDGGDGEWRHLATPQELVEFYEPTDLFGDLSDALERMSPIDAPDSTGGAAAHLQGLIALYRARSGRSSDGGPHAEARLVEQFAEAAEPSAHTLGEILLVDLPDERITLESDGRFGASVVPDEEDGTWKELLTTDQLVEYYTPAELLDRLAERLRTAYPDSAAEGDSSAVRLLEDLAREFEERSRDREGELIGQFELEAASLAEVVGNTTIVDDEDERLVFGADGRFTASVVPKDQPGVWQSLQWPEELVMFYDPTDMFADLADALDEAYPQADGPAVVGDSQP